MNDEGYKQLRNKLADLRKQTANSRFGPVAASIPFLMSLLEETQETNFRKTLYIDLSSEALRQRNFNLSLHFLREACREFHDDPMTNTSLSYALASEHADVSAARKESIALGKKALNLAIEQKRMVKWCGCYLARVALLVDDYEALHLAIFELVHDADNQYEEDSGYEFDFVESIDPQRFDKNLLEQYKELKSIRT